MLFGKLGPAQAFFGTPTAARPYSALTTRQPSAPGSRGVASRPAEDYIQPSSLPACRRSAPCPFPARLRPRGGEPPRRRPRLPPQESHERTRRSGDKTNPAAPGAFRKYPREPDGPLAPGACKTNPRPEPQPKNAERTRQAQENQRLEPEPVGAWGRPRGLPRTCQSRGRLKRTGSERRTT
jgi:hypothetical protein